MGVTGGWGALLTKADIVGMTIPKSHVSAVVSATALLRSEGYETPGWTFGARINGVAFNRILPVGLLGNMAVDERYGYALSEQEKPRLLKVSGHAWSSIMAEMPKTNFNLLHWAARLKLCFNNGLPKEPRRRTEVVDALMAAYRIGVLDAGIALARGYESLKTDKARLDALALYTEIGDRHPMSAYVLAHNALGEGRSAEAELLMQASARFGYPPAITDLGLMAFQGRNQAQGLALLKKAMTLGDPQAAFKWAETQIQQGLYAEALGALRKAWATGHQESLDLAHWLSKEMLEKGLGKRSMVKHELKDIQAFMVKRSRMEEQAAGAA
jgi:TPR repeat protein